MKLSPFQQEHIEETYRLTRLSGLNQNLDFNSWKKLVLWSIFDNPYRESRIAGHILEEKDQILAFHYYLYHPLRIYDQEKISAESGDFVVHPKCRGTKGIIFMKTSSEYFKNKSDNNVMFGLTANRVNNKIWMYIGALGVPKTDITYSGIISKKKLIKQKLSRYPYLRRYNGIGLGVLSEIYLRWMKKKLLTFKEPSLLVEIPLNLANADTEEVDQVCQQYFDSFDIGVIKTCEYLRWRYLNHPFAETYHAFGLRTRDHELLGVGILQIKVSGSVYICELIYNPGYPAIEEEMIAAANDTAIKIGGATIHTKFINDGLEALFQKYNLDSHKKHYDQFVLFAESGIEGARATFTYGDLKKF